ncbi:MAG: right-handed parallel beta-helix repeat-containing protein [Polyangiales bacterium]
MVLALVACGDDSTSDAGADVGGPDAPLLDAPELDAPDVGAHDVGAVDATTDAGPNMDAAADTGTDAGPSLPGTSVASYGCACDGVTDDTECLLEALADFDAWNNRTLEWPADATCIAANLTWAAPTGEESSPFILRGNGAVLKAPDGHPVRATSPWDPIMRVNGGQWLVFDDLNLDGNRDTRVPAENPSHSILIMSSRDVLIESMDSIDAVADGIYIASRSAEDLESRPQRIIVRNPIVRRAYRNNISIINCVDCEVSGDGNGTDSTCQLTGAQGTPPQAGIDFEPNRSNVAPAILNNTLDGCYISGNYGTGILLHNAGEPRGITVRNNTVEGERRTFRATCGAAMHLASNDVLIEDNVFQNYDIDPECRAMFDWGALSETPSTTVFRNNRIENVRFESGSTHLFRIHPVNQGGHTITGNTLVNVGTDEGGDWCLDGSGDASLFEDNTIDGVLQSPNPGCP